jgi:hypothetical protein
LKEQKQTKENMLLYYLAMVSTGSIGTYIDSFFRHYRFDPCQPADPNKSNYQALCADIVQKLTDFQISTATKSMSKPEIVELLPAEVKSLDPKLTHEDKSIRIFLTKLLKLKGSWIKLEAVDDYYSLELKGGYRLCFVYDPTRGQTTNKGPFADIVLYNSSDKKELALLAAQ